MSKTLITIGTFDGVHKGHQKLLAELKKQASLNNLKPLALVFKIAPKAIIKKQETSVILEDKERLKLFQDIEVKFLDFNKIKDISCNDFFTLLIKKYKMGGFLCGRDFAFGRERRGNIPFLREVCKQNNIKLFIIDFLQDNNGIKVSSSRLRKCLAEGNFAEVNKILGIPYTLQGKVIKGQQLGRKIGFPTANLKFPKEQILPFGVFAVWVYVKGKKYKGMCNIGFRPTVEIDGLPLLEVNIFNFNQDIYGENIKIEFVKKVRAEKHFAGLGELTEQLNKDLFEIDKLLN